MQEFKDYYAILKISQYSTRKEVRTAYKKQSMEWHPDRNPGLNTTKMMQEINEANQVLSNPITREKFNQEYYFFKEQIRQQQQSNKEKQKKQENNEWQNRQQREYSGNEKFYEENIDPLEDEFLNKIFDEQIRSKTDKELIDICLFASEYHPVFIYKVVTELKRRNYAIEAIRDLLKQKQETPLEEKSEAVSWKYLFRLYLAFCVFNLLFHGCNK